MLLSSPGRGELLCLAFDVCYAHRNEEHDRTSILTFVLGVVSTVEDDPDCDTISDELLHDLLQRHLEKCDLCSSINSPN